MAMVKWKDRALRAKAALARARDELEGAVPHIRHDSEVILAGMAAGAVRGAVEGTGKEYAIPGPNGTKIDPEAVAGLLLEGLAFSKQTPFSSDIHAMASGMLAYIGGYRAQQWFKQRPARRAANGGG